MKKLLSKEELIAFEDEIADCFNNKLIRAPVHLYHDNEEQMIEIFKEVKEDDWCFCTWRSHYQCLLKGVPREQIKKDILDGRSIEMCYKDYNIFSSAIVGGNISIALGTAMDIKRKKQTNKVWCFVGDMCAMTGQFHEAYVYAVNHDLPIVFVIEDNAKSVCTNTRQTWNNHKLNYEPEEIKQCMLDEKQIYKSKFLWYYKYDLHKKYQHSGTGIRIQF